MCEQIWQGASLGRAAQLVGGLWFFGCGTNCDKVPPRTKAQEVKSRGLDLISQQFDHWASMVRPEMEMIDRGREILPFQVICLLSGELRWGRKQPRWFSCCVTVCRGFSNPSLKRLLLLLFDSALWSKQSTCLICYGKFQILNIIQDNQYVNSDILCKAFNFQALGILVVLGASLWNFYSANQWSIQGSVQLRKAGHCEYWRPVVLSSSAVLVQRMLSVLFPHNSNIDPASTPLRLWGPAGNSLWECSWLCVHRGWRAACLVPNIFIYLCAM